MTKVYDSIKNGEKWYDVDGNPMTAQFPHILYHEGKYYFYGSNKEFSKGNNGIWHWGIKMYESTDMYNWKDLGLIIPPNETDEDYVLNPKKLMDAPNIIYNEKTGKFVCWLINLGTRRAHTFTADKITGPYIPVHKEFLPCGQGMGDFDLAKTEDGRAFIFFNRPHVEVLCAELTDDYTSVKGTYTTLFPHPESVPYNRESPAYMYRNGKHYLITSGTTTFFPNPSEVAVSDNISDDYVILGDPHIGDESRTSFHSQIRSIFKVPGKKDLYIALADRWLPDYMDIPYEVYEEWHIVYHGRNATREDQERIEKESNGMIFPQVFDISKAQYVVLPITFEGDKPTIHWRDSWKLEEFE